MQINTLAENHSTSEKCIAFASSFEIIPQNYTNADLFHIAFSNYY